MSTQSKWNPRLKSYFIQPTIFSQHFRSKARFFTIKICSKTSSRGSSINQTNRKNDSAIKFLLFRIRFIFENSLPLFKLFNWNCFNLTIRKNIWLGTKILLVVAKLHSIFDKWAIWASKCPVRNFYLFNCTFLLPTQSHSVWTYVQILNIQQSVFGFYNTS